MPSPPGEVVQFVIPHPNTPQAVVIYGPEKGHSQERLQSRKAILLKPGKEAWESVQLTSGRLDGLAIRPGEGLPMMAYWNQELISFRTMDGEDLSLGSVDCKGVTAAVFSPDGEHFVARTKSHGFQDFLLQDKDGSVTIRKLGVAENRQPGPAGALADSACDRFVYFVENGQCGMIDYTKSNPPVQSFVALSNFNQCPFFVTCQPDPHKPARAVFAGRGQHAHFMGDHPGNWKKVQIAPPHQEFAASGIDWLDSWTCIGWRRRGPLFIFKAPSIVEKIRKTQPTPLSVTPDYLGIWQPPAETIIANVRILRPERKIIVYIAPLPEAERPLKEDTGESIA